MNYDFKNCNSLAECAAREATYLNDEISKATNLFKLQRAKFLINLAAMERQNEIMEDMLNANKNIN